MKLKEYMSSDDSLDLSDEELFGECIDFIIELDEEQLTEEQIEKAEMILASIDEDEDEDSIEEVKLAGRTSAEKKRMSKKYYRKHKTKIKQKRKKFRKSSAGKKRKKIQKRMAKVGKTATGKKKVRYH